MKKKLVLPLLLLICCNVSGQYAIKDDSKVLTAKERGVLEKAIDYQIDFYSNILPDSVVIKKTDVSLNIYTDYASFLLYQKEQMGRTLIHSKAFYSSKNKEAVVCKDKNEERFLESCYHELSHFFVNTYFKSIPVWANEGLAVYFENVNISNKGIKHRKVNRYRTRVKTMIDTRDIDLKDFVTWTGKKFTEVSFSHDSYGYALGYSMILFLMEKDKDFVVKLLQQLNDKKSSAEAIDSFYEGGFDAFEKDFLSYISK